MGTRRPTRGKYPCPQCREGFAEPQLHPIYLECTNASSQGSDHKSCHSEEVHAQALYAMRHLMLSGDALQFQGILRAIKELDKLLELMDNKDCFTVCHHLVMPSPHLNPSLA